MRRLTLPSWVLLPLLVVGGCSHTDEKAQAEEQARRQEMEVLKERVRRLERRLSDLDTKISLVLERAEQQEQGAPPSAVSSGAPLYRGPGGPAPGPGYPAQPQGPQAPAAGYGAAPRGQAYAAPAAGSSTYTPPTFPTGTWPSGTAPTPLGPEEPPPAMGPGAVPYDIPRPNTRPVSVDPDPSEPLDVGEDPSGSVTLIDQEALARLTGDAAPEAPAYSRTPNRPITRQDTRPEPPGRAAAPLPRRPDPPVAASPASGRMPLGNPKKLYDWAMARREEGDCAQAVGAFDEVLKRWPKHHLADNAIYWTGVCHQTRGAYSAALTTWSTLPLRYPKSAKIPDALYGMAQVHEAQGEPKKATDLYLQLIDQYPDAERSAEARQALARMRGR